MAKYVLYLKRDGFDFFSVEKNATYTFAFSQQSVMDLEVLDENKMRTEIVTFLQTNQIIPGICDIILSDSMVFAADFVKDAKPVDPATPPTQGAQVQTQLVAGTTSEEVLKANIDEFLKKVPFENITSKTTQMANGFRVVAANKDFYTTIVMTLTSEKFMVEAVVPIALVTKSLQNPPTLSFELLQLVQQNPETLRETIFFSWKHTSKNSSRKRKMKVLRRRSRQKAECIFLVVSLGFYCLFFSLSYTKHISLRQNPLSNQSTRRLFRTHLRRVPYQVCQ